MLAATRRVTPLFSKIHTSLFRWSQAWRIFSKAQNPVEFCKSLRNSCSSISCFTKSTVNIRNFP